MHMLVVLIERVGELQLRIESQLDFIIIGPSGVTFVKCAVYGNRQFCC